MLTRTGTRLAFKFFGSPNLIQPKSIHIFEPFSESKTLIPHTQFNPRAKHSPWLRSNPNPIQRQCYASKADSSSSVLNHNALASSSLDFPVTRTRGSNNALASSSLDFPVTRTRGSSFFHGGNPLSAGLAAEEVHHPSPPPNSKKKETDNASPPFPVTEAFLGPTTARQKPRIVVLGSGWAGCRFMRDIDTSQYDIVCVSPRNHMVFTPLLASTCVGTLEFRSVAEPVRSIQPAISTSPDSYFFLAKCSAIDPDNHQIFCEGMSSEGGKTNGHKFRVAYDKLVISAGADPSTFGIPGVGENAIFLREVDDAVKIRRKLLYNLMKSEIPGVPVQEKQRLLSCVVVGGGPTGVEFSGELSDFILRDVCSKFTHVRGYISVTLIEANELLSSFDVRLRQYATHQLHRSGVRLVKGVVKEVHADKVVLSNGSEVPYGLLVWSTGVGPSSFIKSLNVEKSPCGRIGVDDWMQVKGLKDVFAIGDCSGYHESTKKPVLPALAQVAEREGKYLASYLNKVAAAGGARAGMAPSKDFSPPPFVYRHLGSMATIGRYKALVDLRESTQSRGLSFTGFTSWLVWRSAYLTRVVSWRNRLYVAVNWATTLLFGRDISRL